MHTKLKNLSLRISVSLVPEGTPISAEDKAVPGIVIIETSVDDDLLRFVVAGAEDILATLTQGLLLDACPGCHIDKHGHVVEGSAPETDSELELKLRSLDQEPVNQPPDREQILQDIRPGGRPVKD